MHIKKPKPLVQQTNYRYPYEVSIDSHRNSLGFISPYTKSKMLEWIWENGTGAFCDNGHRIWFEKSYDALRFKLIW